MNLIDFQDVLGAGNDVNKCALYTKAFNESDGESCVEESVHPRCTRSKKKGI